MPNNARKGDLVNNLVTSVSDIKRLDDGSLEVGSGARKPLAKYVGKNIRNLTAPITYSISSLLTPDDGLPKYMMQSLSKTAVDEIASKLYILLCNAIVRKSEPLVPDQIINQLNDAQKAELHQNIEQYLSIHPDKANLLINLIRNMVFCITTGYIEKSDPTVNGLMWLTTAPATPAVKHMVTKASNYLFSPTQSHNQRDIPTLQIESSSIDSEHDIPMTQTKNPSIYSTETIRPSRFPDALPSFFTDGLNNLSSFFSISPRQSPQLNREEESTALLGHGPFEPLQQIHSDTEDEQDSDHEIPREAGPSGNTSPSIKINLAAKTDSKTNGRF